VWIDGQSRFFARRADPGECLGHIGFGFKVDIHGMRHRKVAVEVAVRVGDHEVDIHGQIGVARRRLDKGRTERDVVHKMTVHHIAVDPVRPRAGHLGYFLAESREVTGQDRRGNDNFHGPSLR